MFRIDTDGSVNGQFSDGDLTQGVPGTRVSAAWMTTVQEEIARLIESAGLTLDKGNNAQLVAAAVAAATALTLVRRDASGRAQFADPAANADAATKRFVENGATQPALLAVNSYWSQDGNCLPHYWRNRAGEVRLHGGVIAHAGAGGVIGTLPVGFRPATNRYFVVPLGTGSASLVVWANGDISVANPVGETEYMLDPVSFLAEQ